VNSGGRPKDPVGEEFPVETSETRAWRRCLKLLVSHVPDEVRRIQMAEEDAQVSLSSVIDYQTTVEGEPAPGTQRNVETEPVFQDDRDLVD
jgi:hypothetical protein